MYSRPLNIKDRPHENRKLRPLACVGMNVLQMRLTSFIFLQSVWHVLELRCQSSSTPLVPLRFNALLNPAPSLVCHLKHRHVNRQGCLHSVWEVLEFRCQNSAPPLVPFRRNAHLKSALSLVCHFKHRHVHRQGFLHSVWEVLEFRCQNSGPPLVPFRRNGHLKSAPFWFVT